MIASVLMVDLVWFVCFWGFDWLLLVWVGVGEFVVGV